MKFSDAICCAIYLNVVFRISCCDPASEYLLDSAENGCIVSPIVTYKTISMLICSIQCSWLGPDCIGFKYDSSGTCEPYSNVSYSNISSPGIVCANKTYLTTSSPSSTTPSASTTVTTLRSTVPPLMPGLHPTNTYSCGLNEMPYGAYQVQVAMPDGSTQFHHYMVCNDKGVPFRQALEGSATTRAFSCPLSTHVYAGFENSIGPCARLASGWTSTMNCRSGDNQGVLPSSLPASYIRYIGCGGIPGYTNYAITAYYTASTGYHEELVGVLCCEVIPA